MEANVVAEINKAAKFGIVVQDKDGEQLEVSKAELNDDGLIVLTLE